MLIVVLSLTNKELTKPDVKIKSNFKKVKTISAVGENRLSLKVNRLNWKLTTIWTTYDKMFLFVIKKFSLKSNYIVLWTGK